MKQKLLEMVQVTVSFFSFDEIREIKEVGQKYAFFLPCKISQNQGI